MKAVCWGMATSVMALIPTSLYGLDRRLCVCLSFSPRHSISFISKDKVTKIDFKLRISKDKLFVYDEHEFGHKLTEALFKLDMSTEY